MRQPTWIKDNGDPASGGAADATLRQVASPAELQGLPSGTLFIDPNGVTRRIP
jgi:hypothetical protein